eukprot:1149032-Pelagomonas_calceolata.AAC.6
MEGPPFSLLERAAHEIAKTLLVRHAPRFTLGCPGSSSARPALKLGMQAKQTKPDSTVVPVKQGRLWAKSSGTSLMASMARPAHPPP